MEEDSKYKADKAVDFVTRDKATKHLPASSACVCCLTTVQCDVYVTEVGLSGNPLACRELAVRHSRCTQIDILQIARYIFNGAPQ